MVQKVTCSFVAPDAVMSLTARRASTQRESLEQAASRLPTLTAVVAADKKVALLCVSRAYFKLTVLL